MSRAGADEASAPDRGRALALSRAEALLDLRRGPQAAAVVAPLLASDPQDVRAHGLMVRALLHAERPHDALVHANAAVSLRPEDPLTHLLAGWTLTALGDHGEAVRAASEARRLAPWSDRPLVLLAAALQGRGRLREAREAAREAVRLDPEHPEAHLALGNAHLAAGRGAGAWRRRREARRAFRRVLALRPDDAVAVHNLGVASMQGRPVVAARLVGEGLRLDPTSRQGRLATYLALSRVLAACHLLLLPTALAAGTLDGVEAPGAALVVATVPLLALAGVVVHARRRLPSGTRRLVPSFAREYPFVALWAGLVVLGATTAAAATAYGWAAGGWSSPVAVPAPLLPWWCVLLGGLAWLLRSARRRPPAGSDDPGPDLRGRRRGR